MDIKELVGKTLTHIDVDEENNIIMLTTDDGKQLVMSHKQECCEMVRIEDTRGDWNSLLNNPLIEVSVDTESWRDETDWNDEDKLDTIFTFKVTDATVINKWHGSSNGCYSTDVELDWAIQTTK